MNNPLISILINCYNSEKFIHECLNSAINQSYQNIEIIIWDNHSSDNTSLIIHKFNDPRIRYFKNDKHTSLGEARILASKHIKGEYIAILDSDDIAYPNRILDQISYLQRNPDFYLIGGWMNIINQKSTLKSKYTPSFKKISLDIKIFWTNPLIHSSIMYDVNIARKIGWYNNKIVNFQDYALILKFNSKKYKFTCLKKIIGAKREHNLNSIKNPKTKIIQFKEYKILLRYARKFISKDNDIIFKMNNNSIQLNDLYYLTFSFNKNKNINNLIKLSNFLFKNFFSLVYFSLIRRFIL